MVAGRQPDRLRVLRDAARRPLGADPRPLDGQRADGAADPASPSAGEPQLVSRRASPGVLHAGSRTVSAVRPAPRQAGERRLGPGREGHPQDDLPRRRGGVSRGRLQPDLRGAGRGRLAATAHHRSFPPPEPALLDSRRGAHRVLGEPATRRTEGTRGQRDPPGGARRRRDPHPDLPARPGREPGGLAGWRADCLSGLRRPLPGVPGHQALRHEPRRLVADGGDRFARPGRRPPAVERGERRALLPVRRRGGHQGGVRAPRRRGRRAVFRPGRHLPRPSLRGRFLFGRRKRVVRLHVGNDRAPRRRLDRAGRRAGHRAQRGPARAPGDRRDEGDLARVLVRRTSDPGLGGDAARIRSLPEVPADPRDPRRPVHQLRVPVHRRGAAVRRRGLRRALREPARQHLLWRGVREPDPPRLSQPGLRRPDERGGRGDRRGLRGREQPLRHRRQRRRGADELDRGAHRPVRRRGGRQAGHQLVQLRADRGRLRVLLPLLVPRVPVGPPRALPRAFRRSTTWGT